MDGDKVFHPFGDMPYRMVQADRERVSEWMLDTGLLWAVNKFLFHPFGVALTVEVRRKEGEVGGTDPDDEMCYGYMWLTPSADGWEFDEETDLDGRKKFEAFLSSDGFNGTLRFQDGVLSAIQMAANVIAKVLDDPAEEETGD